MNFFEGRIYKAQGFNLENTVHSRVPVVRGSLSVQDGILYYCKSCTYDSTSKMFDLEWIHVKGPGASSDVYNRAEGQECVTVNAGSIIEDATIKGKTTKETIFTQLMSLDSSEILGKYPTKGSLLATTIGTTEVPISDLLLYASNSKLSIDGQYVDRHYYFTSRRTLSADLIAKGCVIPPSEHHLVVPISATTKTNGIRAYMPSYGVTHVSDYFDTSKNAVIDVMIFGENIYTLIGAHIILHHRDRMYAGVISELTKSGSSSYVATMIEEIHSNESTFKVTKISVATSQTALSLYDDVNVDECTSGISRDLKTVQMTFNITSDITSPTAERFMCCVKLDPSFVTK